MYRDLRTGFLTLSAALLATVGSATATTITTTSFQTWKASLTGAPSEADFSAVQYTSYNTASGLTLSASGSPANSFVFTGTDNGSFQLSGTSFNNFASLADSSDAGAAINIAMPGTGKNAILLGLASTSGTPITITLSDGEMFTPSNGLFGFSASHQITSITVTASAGSQAFVNDLWFGASSLTQDPAQGGGGSPAGDPTSTPEGATLLMMVGGSLILVGARRKLGLTLSASFQNQF